MHNTLQTSSDVQDTYKMTHIHQYFLLKSIACLIYFIFVIWLHQEETELDTKVKEVLFFTFSSTHCSLVIYLFASVLILYLSPSHFQNQVK